MINLRNHQFSVREKKGSLRYLFHFFDHFARNIPHGIVHIIPMNIPLGYPKTDVFPTTWEFRVRFELGDLALLELS